MPYFTVSEIKWDKEEKKDTSMISVYCSMPKGASWAKVLEFSNQLKLFQTSLTLTTAKAIWT